MGTRANRFLSGRGGTGGLVREQQRTNRLLEDILTELRHANRREDAATDGPALTRT